VSLLEALLEVAHGDERAVLFTALDGPDRGKKLLVRPERGETHGDAPAGLATLVDDLRRSCVVEFEGVSVFADVYGRPPRLVVVGAVDTGEALCAGARALGWHTVCVDPRARFATSERVPSAEEIVVAWPEEAFAKLVLDRDTAVVVLTHDDKFDVPALKAALATEAFYVGALGSRRNQERRRERLLDAGVDESQLDRISGPCGLDLGAESQPETAISILAEIIAVRNSRDGGKLQQSKQRIHVEVAE
jgi:xanthine dehydrogenase accessory factor